MSGSPAISDEAQRENGRNAEGGVPVGLSSCPLEEVLRTEELHQRGSRAANFQLENEGLTLLMETLANAPRQVLAKLVEVAHRACEADAAGVSLKECGRESGGREVFRWVATAGNLAPFLNHTLPGEFSPCGETIRLREPQLMADPVRYYPYIGELPFHIGEVLLVPFFKDKTPVGTVWITLTHPTRKFDQEDLRLVTNLAKFATAAHETLTQLEVTEEANRKYREVALKMEVALEAGSIATWTWYVNTNRVYADAELAKWFSLTDEEANGGPREMYLDAILPEDRPEVEAQIAKSLAEKGEYETECRLRQPDGSIKWVVARGRMLKDPGPEPVLSGVLADITKQKHHEEALRVARDEAVALTRAKDDFLAALSHELRTPLNPVLLLASAAAANEELPEKVREDFESIRQNVELEARLIDDLLDLTKLAHGKMVMEKRPVGIHDVLRHSWDKVEAMVKDKQIGMSWKLAEDLADTLMGDPVRLQQVFWNLLSNAAKFTPAGGDIVIATELSGDGESIIIRVTDTGLGIDPSRVETIFDEFSQGSHGSTQEQGRRNGGLGLGLAISKRLVELHGGVIRAESEGFHEGSSFITTLPLLKRGQEREHDGMGVSGGHAFRERKQPVAVTDSDESARDEREARDEGKDKNTNKDKALNILLVEDHDLTREVILRLLKRTGYTVQAAATGAAALEMAGGGVECDFDLVLSDLGLPDMNGYALLMELKKLKPALIGIALSGYGTEQDREESRKAGFAEHLTKPISLPALEEAIGRVILKG